MVRRLKKDGPTAAPDEAPASPVERPRPLTLGREIAAILLFSSTLLTILALLSYSPYDPGAFSFGTASVAPANWVGILGAFWSSLLVHILGLTALYIPLFMARLGYFVMARQSLLQPGRYVLWLSLVLSQATFLQWAFGNLPLPLFEGSVPIALGGVTGIIFGEILQRATGTAGAAIIFPLWVVITLMVFFRVSFLGLLRRAFSPVGSAAERWKVRRERKRQESAREAMRDQIRQRQEERVKRDETKAASREVRIAERGDPTPALPLEAPPRGGYRLPPLDLLDPPRPRPPVNEHALRAKSTLIEERLLEFDIAGEVVEIHPGPVVTIFEFKLAPGVKYTRITSLEEDLALALKADHIRVDRVSGKSHVGIEVPNDNREIISFRELIESKAYIETPGRLPLALGKSVEGMPFVTTLDHMPHLLVAGTTGSGKSVGINALIHSILFRSGPDEVKFIMVDPKQVELKVYEGIPHLLTPVVTDVKKAANALNWAVREMSERYKMLASAKVRSIDQYNAYVRSLTPTSAQAMAITRPLPYIVIVIDELYDLMAAVAKEVETAIARLSAMARAVGIHLILATQRPSRDVITGVIKSNLPSRLAFQVREKLESRLILDQNGAETLEGKGDMLYLPPGSGRVARVHGGFLSNTETHRVIQYLVKQGQPEYDQEVLKDAPPLEGVPGSPGDRGDDQEDPLYQDALKLVVQTGVASASHLQRRMRIGYARAARLLDVMEHRGIVGPADGAKPREILMTADELE